MITVRTDSAFAVNLVGAPGHAIGPFPLSLTVERAGDVLTLYGSAAALVELADLLWRPDDTALVFGVGHTVFAEPDTYPMPLGDIARAAGVAAAVRDIGWAFHPDYPAELAVLRAADVPRLFADVPIYDVQVVALPAAVDEARQDEILLAVLTAPRDEPALRGLPDVRASYDGHDDCYVWVETRDPALPLRLLARLLALLAGSRLATDRDVAVAEPPDEVVATLLATDDRWSAWPVAVGDVVSLGLWPRAWRLGDPFPADEPARVLTYDVAAGAWG